MKSVTTNLYHAENYIQNYIPNKSLLSRKFIQPNKKHLGWAKSDTKRKMILRHWRASQA